MNNTPTILPYLTSVNGPFDKDVTESEARPAAGTLGDLRIILYNAQKSWSNLTALLETHQSADVIIVQEMPWANYKRVASATSKDGDIVTGTVHHASFVCIGDSETSSVCIYVNRRLSHLSPVSEEVAGLDNDNVLLLRLTLGNRNKFIRMLNVYNHPKDMAAVRALINNEDTLPHIDVCLGDFNMHHPLWDPFNNNNRHSALATDLIATLQGLLGLCLINTSGRACTWSSNNANVRDQVLDLAWVERSRASNAILDIDMMGRFNSDHAVLLLTLPCNVEAPPLRPTIKRGSKTGYLFSMDLCKLFHLLSVSYGSYEDVQRTCDTLYSDLDRIWHKHATNPRPSKHSSSWWNDQCSELCARLSILRSSLREMKKKRRFLLHDATRDDLDSDILYLNDDILSTQAITINLAGRLWNCIKRAKRQFYDSQLEHLTDNKLWDMVDWMRPRKTASNIALRDPDSGLVSSDPSKVAEILANQFTTRWMGAADLSILQELPPHETRTAVAISGALIREALSKNSNSSTPGPDHILWFWLKQATREIPVLDLSECGDHTDPIRGIRDLYNACLTFGCFPTAFKRSVTVVLPKPNKNDYSHAKSYRPIVLLNCLGKLLEKVIASQMQFDAQVCGLTDELQFGGLMLRSTADAGIHACKHIQKARMRGEDSSAILVDVAQFFPSLDHDALLAILRHYGFPESRLRFFTDYLSGKSTTFLFNGNTTPLSLFDLGVVQGSALSPFLANIYIAPAIQATKRWLLWTYPGVTLQFYIDDGMIITSCKRPSPKEAWVHNASVLLVVFRNIRDNLLRILLCLEADKTEAIHFTRRRKYKNDLPGPSIWLPPKRSSRDGTLVTSVTTARYLGIYLDTTLFFRAHQKFYFTKAESTLSTLRMLGNSIRGLNPRDKRRLYIANVLPVISYCAQLWWCPNWKGNKEAANMLQRIQN
jgi:hypothetical protein